MKLQDFGFDLKDIIPANVQTISHLVSFACSCKFYEEPSTKVYGVFDRFHELTGFTSYHKTVVHDRVHGLIPKNIYQVPHLLPSNLPNNF